MRNESRLVLKAAQGRAVPLGRGRHLRIVNIHGTQVVDTWAFVAGGVAEYLSLEHCREVLQTLYYAVGDSLVTNLQRPILTIVADTSPGTHDTLIAACNGRMYELAGRGPDHANCSDNLRRALAGERLAIGHVPAPWNLFMSAPVRDGSCCPPVPTTSTRRTAAAARHATWSSCCTTAREAAQSDAAPSPLRARAGARRRWPRRKASRSRSK